MRKVITRIKGGLGNQLFCYAAARRLALVNNVELVIDHVSGFVRDRLHHRKYMLDRFCIPARKATKRERLEPFERYRRGLMKWLARRKPFTDRHYLEQEGRDFDDRLLTMKVKGLIYLDGLWQSENYFKDVAQLIREDLRIIPPTDAPNQRMAERIRRNTAVALHMRWFAPPTTEAAINMSPNYYQRAIAFIEQRIEAPSYVVFSDDPEAARTTLHLPDCRVTYVTHNRDDECSFADLWLMTLCQHFIIANSTFSWWGAWLAESPGKIIIAPRFVRGKFSSANWGFRGLIPSGWLML